MKIRIKMVDSDGVYEGIRDATYASLKDTKFASNEALDAAHTARHLMLERLCSKWLAYGEELTVEIDVEQGTIQVVPNNG